jgi:hypothetical protein
MGHVERRADPEDRRARRVFLTPRGEAVRPIGVAAKESVDGDAVASQAMGFDQVGQRRQRQHSGHARRSDRPAGRFMATKPLAT